MRRYKAVETAREKRMARNSMSEELGARCQVRSRVERIRFFPAHQVMSRRLHNSVSIIMHILNGMARFLFCSYLVFFSHFLVVTVQ